MLEKLLDSSQDDLSANKMSFWLDASLQEETSFKAKAQNGSHTDALKWKGKRTLSQVPKSLPYVLALQQESLITQVQHEIFLETKKFPCTPVPRFPG